MKFEVKPSHEIKGEIKISGSKNSCLPLIACCLLTSEKLILENVPLITDVINMIKIMEKLGVQIQYSGLNKTLVLQARRITGVALFEEVAKIRASYYVMGALLSRKRKVVVPYPGGCNLGSRPIDFHIEAFKRLGSLVFEHEKDITLINKNLKNATVIFDKQSVGATINTILASVKIKNTTIIKNASLEPEVLDVIHCLKKMGASILIRDQNTVEITGVKRLKGTNHAVMFDRIELGSFLCLASGFSFSHLKITGLGQYKDYSQVIESITSSLTKLGVSINYFDDYLEVKSTGITESIDLETGVFPSFPTDLQPIFSVMLLSGSKQSTVTETIFSNRFSHIPEIRKMQGTIEVIGNKQILIPSKLVGTTVYAHDLRSGFSLIVAATRSEGSTIIDNADVILRGYEDIASRLVSIGVNITADCYQ